MSKGQDKRRLHALRAHIDDLLADGAALVGRDPLTLVCANGQTLRVKHGMLVGYSGLLDMVEPVSDHEWPDALKQMVIDLCIQQLDEAIRRLTERDCSVDLAASANDDRG